jgi:predicted AlkP superfamily pyrophosphatase or phosphodiesterase
VTPVPELSLPRHYVVLIVVDAGKPSYYSLARLPNIGALMRGGVVYDRAWVGEMESTTPNVHVTFGTGTLPKENGFLGFGWAAPQTRKTVDFRALLANGAIDPVLRALPVPSVAARLHQYLPQSVSVAASGHKDYAVVGLGGGAASYELFGKFVNHRFQPAFMHTPPPLSPAELKSLDVPTPLKLGAEDSWAVQYALDVVRRVRPKLLMINLPELDTWGHWYGPSNAAPFRQLMLNVDRQIGQIEAVYRQLGLLGRTDFIITADHSMMESRAAHNWHTVWDAASAVHATVARGDGEGGSVWLQDPGQAKAVAERLVKMHPAHVEAIFYRSAPGLSYSYVQASPVNWLVSPQAATALQNLVDTAAGRNGPDLWVLYRENYTVVPRNVQGVWKGTHGGATWKVQNVPLILAGPGIRPGVHSSFPARAIDVTPTIERLLGLPPTHRDGVLLADALTDATKGEMKAPDLLAPSLAADVEALKAQSTADVRMDHPSTALSRPLVQCGRAGAKGQICKTTPIVATNQ